MKTIDQNTTTTETYVEKELRLEITGTLWCGQHTAHSYLLRANPPKTLAEAKHIAGDFSLLDSARIVTVSREIKETITTVDLV